jgi:hypothetical protein
MNAYELFVTAKEERRKKWAETTKKTNKGSFGGMKKEETNTRENLVTWKKLSNCDQSKSEPSTATSPVPLILLTVNTPNYRARYEETMQHLTLWQRNCTCIQDKSTQQCHAIRTDSCDMLNLEDHPTLGVKKIVYEGWRRVFLPKMLHDYHDQAPIHFVMAAEDDIRIPNHIAPCTLMRICQDAFRSFPSIDILSLGHSWKAVQKVNKRTTKDDINSNLLHYLQETKGAGVHGATLFAVRFPRGIQRLQEALDRATAQGTHLDQFLFYSPHHDLQIALCDPPLVGWAEVDTTLTKSSSGHRRKGGGRLGFLPKASLSPDEGLIWIQRVLLKEE